ncbi:hypothetical protein RFI_08296 [Reticulomyxa filosa]|uniref:Uncharacterized protein n=1 Tax=Reticulomyxa filosa TaxID=46433 RepID=X6NR98_RETFI|nr:hypothetical protein RFI_08296 [Reticulomyxa filosa]|eukprot:ETO28830.1 hypothetical protein RFI_08296 [Reticulomyxa filosa]
MPSQMNDVVIDPCILFETDKCEHFLGIDASDHWLNRIQTFEYRSNQNSSDHYPHLNPKATPTDVSPAQTHIGISQVKFSSSVTAFASVATIVRRFSLYSNKLSTEIPSINNLRFDRWKVLVGETLTQAAGRTEPDSTKRELFHHHFLEWLSLRLSANRKREMEGHMPVTNLVKNNYTRNNGLVFMVVMRNLVNALSDRSERNLDQRYADASRTHYYHYSYYSPYGYGYGSNEQQWRKAYATAASKTKFYTQKLKELRENINSPEERGCLMEFTKELQVLLFPMENESTAYFEELLYWSVDRVGLEVIQLQENCVDLNVGTFKGLVKAIQKPPGSDHIDEKDIGTWDVTVSACVKKVQHKTQYKKRRERG